LALHYARREQGRRGFAAIPPHGPTWPVMAGGVLPAAAPDNTEALPQWDVACKAVDEEHRTSSASLRAVACTSDTVITASSKPIVKVWKVAEGKVAETHKLRHGAVGSSCVEVADSGSLAAVCSDDGGIRLWDLRTQKRAGELHASLPTAWKVKFTADGNRLVSGGPSGVLNFWDLRKQALLCEISSESSATRDENDSKRRRRDGRGNELGTGRRPSSCVFSLAVSGDGRLLGCGRGNGTISVMRMEDQEWVSIVHAHRGEHAVPVRGLAFDASSRLLFSGGDDHHACLLDAAALARPRSDGSVPPPQLERFSAHRGWVTSICACPDPMRRLLVTTSWDNTVKLWDYRAQALLRTYKEHTDSVMACAFQPSQGRFFVTVGCDAQIVLHVEQSQALMPMEKSR